MKRVLILFAHPKFERSRANKSLVEIIKDLEGVTFHDLYEHYPDFNINVKAEKKLLQEHDVIIWHHPFYWYSCPPLMKQWMDVVLEFGWAYGPQASALQTKKCFNVITTGGTREVYCPTGTNKYSISEFLRPFEQTAKLCGMEYLPPFTVMGTHNIGDLEIEKHTLQYKKLIGFLLKNQTFGTVNTCEFLNDTPGLNKEIDK